MVLARNLQKVAAIFFSLFVFYQASGQVTLELTDEFKVFKSKQYNLKYADVYLVDSNITHFLNKTDCNRFVLLTPHALIKDVITIQIETCKFYFYLELESKYLENNNLKLNVYQISRNINRATLSIVNLAVRLPLKVKVVKKKRKVRCKKWIK